MSYHRTGSQEESGDGFLDTPGCVKRTVHPAHKAAHTTAHIDNIRKNCYVVMETL